MLVVPAHQLRGHLQSASFGISLIHRVFDSPARGALADLHRHTDLWSVSSRPIIEKDEQFLRVIGIFALLCSHYKISL
jgi:hypothetical protein